MLTMYQVCILVATFGSTGGETWCLRQVVEDVIKREIGSLIAVETEWLTVDIKP